MLEKLTRRAISKAIKDYDARGRDGFLEHHGAKHRRAKSYFICHRECEYDLKAIVYVALLPLSENRSPGHSPRVAEAVTELGFTVIHTGKAASPARQIPASKSREGREIWKTQRERRKIGQFAKVYSTV